MTKIDPAARLAARAVTSRHDLQVMNYLVPTVVDLGMPIREQPLADRLRIGERDLAAQEPRRERRHRGS